MSALLFDLCAWRPRSPSRPLDAPAAVKVEAKHYLDREGYNEKRAAANSGQGSQGGAAENKKRAKPVEPKPRPHVLPLPSGELAHQSVQIKSVISTKNEEQGTVKDSGFLRTG